MGYTDKTDTILISDFPAWFSAHVRWWAYDKYRKGKKRSEFPTKGDHELYAEKVGVEPDQIAYLMTYSTEKIPAEVLINLGMAVSTEIREVMRKERVACLVKCCYKDHA
jgi:hypothetical protein